MSKFFLAFAAILLSTACGRGPGAPSSFDGSAGVRFSVMTFNIQHGIDANGRYGLQRAIQVIARVQPDIVGLQEVTRNHPAYNCEDQPALIAAGVSAQTGTSWTGTYQQEWFTAESGCVRSGRGDGNATEGLMWLTRRSMGAPVGTVLPNTRLLLHTQLRDARDVSMTVTHLDGSAIRVQQIDRLLAWAASAPDPRILIGDFNMRPDDSEMLRLFGSFHDAWTDAQRIGRATGSELTHRSSRIDYVLWAGSRLTVESVDVLDTVALVGVEASDHRPVVATFTLR